MSTENSTKINQLLQKTPSGVVLASNWLSQQGYCLEFIRNYNNSKWLVAFGNGAVKRYNDQVDYLGAVYTLQKQLRLSAHPGEKTALGLLGRAHYLEMNQQVVCLIGNEKEKLPTWFKKYHWEQQVSYYTSSFLPPALGMTEFLHKNFSIRVSEPDRAMMECLYLMPKEIILYECYELMEGYILNIWLTIIPKYTIVSRQLLIVFSLVDGLPCTLMAAAQSTGKIKKYQLIVGGLLLLNLPLFYVLLLLVYPLYATLYISLGLTIISLFARLIIVIKLI